MRIFLLASLALALVVSSTATPIIDGAQVDRRGGKLVYPIVALQANVRGSVLIQFQVAGDGTVKSASDVGHELLPVGASKEFRQELIAPAHPLLKKVALDDAKRSWYFAPSEDSSSSIRIAHILYRFVIEDSGSDQEMINKTTYGPNLVTFTIQSARPPYGAIVGSVK
jgi:hypothetical protein